MRRGSTPSGTGTSGPIPSRRRRVAAAGRRGDVEQAGVDVVETAGQTSSVAIERPAAEPGMTGPPIPGDDPVVEREPKRRQALIVDRDRRQALQDVPEVVAEEPDEAAEERAARRPARPASRRDGRARRRATANGSGPAAGDSRTATGSAVRYVQRALRPGRALSSSASPGRSRNGLGDIDRAGRWRCGPGVGADGAMPARCRRARDRRGSRRR